MTKLNIKQKKFVAAKAKGMTNAQAYMAAGYQGTKKHVIKANADRLKSKPYIQEAIDDALELMGMTPEWAVRELKKVAEQDEELGAKRLAIKDVLELQGFKKNQNHNQVLTIENAFFQNTRKKIENESSSTNE